MKNQMTSRERILAAIDLKPVDRIPLDYWGTDEATSKLIKGLFAPCHNIQVITPIENIVAMYKTAIVYNENRF